MPAEHLRRLIERVAPGRSVRELCATAGVPENRLAYYLKPGTALTRMPTIEQIQEIAGILGCTNSEVYRAFRRDVDGTGVLEDDLAEDERELLAAFRSLDASDQLKLLRIIKALHGE